MFGRVMRIDEPRSRPELQHLLAFRPRLCLGVLQMGGEDVKESGVVGDQSEGKGDPRLYSVRVSRVTGIDWGTDLSFKWVYVRALEPSGSGAQAGVAVGDQVPKQALSGSIGAPVDGLRHFVYSIMNYAGAHHGA